MQATDLPKYFANNRFEVIQEDGRVWVNDSTGLIGRYNSRTGIDIHSDGTCDDCRTGKQDFDTFVLGMIAKHNINLSALVISKASSMENRDRVIS